MTGIPKRLAVVAVAVCAAFGGSAAHAQNAAGQATRIGPIEVEPYSVRVRYDDLNLDTASGWGAMTARISRASHLVCQVGLQPLAQQFDRLGCVNEARRDAFEQLAASRTRTYASADRALVFRLDR